MLALCPPRPGRDAHAAQLCSFAHLAPQEQPQTRFWLHPLGNQGKKHFNVRTSQHTSK